MKKILIIDDEQNFRLILSKVLLDEKYKVFQAGTGKEGLEVFEEQNPNLVLLDLNLPDTTGLDVLKKIKQSNSASEILMLTAYGNVSSAVEAIKLGAADYLSKPVDNDELLLKIANVLRTAELKNEVKQLKEKLNGNKVIKEKMGNSKEILKTVELAEIVCNTNMTIILEGKSGTGKELFARMIHQNSSRKSKPFVAVDCGAIPDTLFESEMFGYEKGAFTGAIDRRKGKFEQATGGTLFLDEISNLPMVSQSKFLRAIQEKKIQRLGSKQTIDIDVRIIVASNYSLQKSVDEGKFREDLFYRLNEFSINLPTLLDRKDDIPVLIEYFIREANEELSKNVTGLSVESFKIISEYSWPGNVRELKNVIKRAVLLAGAGIIQKQHLIISGLSKETDITNLKTARVKAEKQTIISVLKSVNGNKSKAAEILKLSRRQLYRKLEEFELSGQEYSR